MVKSIYADILRELTATEEMQEFSNTLHYTDDKLLAILESKGIFLLCDWAEEDNENIIFNFIVHRAKLKFNLVLNMKSEAQKQFKKIYNYARKGAWMDFVIGYYNHCLEETGLCLSTLRTFDDQYRLCLMSVKSFNSLNLYNDEFWKFELIE